MVRRLLAVLAIASALAACQSSPASESQRIGEMVLAVDAAMDRPGNPEALDTIARYGTDTRYYIMIRGWLVQELAGVESQLDATRDPERKAAFQAEADFLRQAIRRIDLE